MSKQEHNIGHIHEAMHTTAVLIDTFNRHVVEAPTAEHYPHIKRQADLALEAMADLYQMLGQVWHETELQAEGYSLPRASSSSRTNK